MLLYNKVNVQRHTRPESASSSCHSSRNLLFAQLSALSGSVYLGFTAVNTDTFPGCITCMGLMCWLVQFQLLCLEND